MKQGNKHVPSFIRNFLEMTYSYASSLHDSKGRRKYLTCNERDRFYGLVESEDCFKRYFLLMLYFSGARISEVLNLNAWQIDFDQGVVVIECLKKRKKGIFRTVPVPKRFLSELIIYLEENEIIGRIWPITRRTGYRYVKAVMDNANIQGVQACPTGLRHSFGVSAVQNNVPINLISNWMGHSSIQVTIIYLNVIGEEERGFAERMWR